MLHVAAVRIERIAPPQRPDSRGIFRNHEREVRHGTCQKLLSMHSAPRRAFTTSCPLSAIDGAPLSDEAQVTLRRARVLLRRVCEPGWQARALLLGYVPQAHDAGLALQGWVAGELELDAWRRLRAMRPPSDPNLPHELAQLEAFADEWTDRARCAAQSVADPGHLRRVLKLQTEVFPSTAWRVTSTIEMLITIAWASLASSREILEQLCADGFEDALTSVLPILRIVREAIRTAAVTDEEIADIHSARERHARELHDWLEARRGEFHRLSEQDRRTIGLGTIPPLPSSSSARGPTHFAIAAKA
jgi:hypothetical protein